MEVIKFHRYKRNDAIVRKREERVESRVTPGAAKLH